MIIGAWWASTVNPSGDNGPYPESLTPLSSPSLLLCCHRLTHAGCTVLGGLLGDAVGRRKIYALSSVVLGLSAVPFFYVLQMGNQVSGPQGEGEERGREGGKGGDRLIVRAQTQGH